MSSSATSRTRCRAHDELDLAVARRSIGAGLPVLGICRGTSF
ncbi:gamma-glutamyl-gamma-aminobutyrate hydrolase family protein [Micrococcaceae bacterium Sec5.8]